MRVLAYRIQATAFGDLDTAILRRLREHRDASFESARPFAARGPTTREGVGLKSGALLVREWNGRLERVMVLDDGYAWNGSVYRSLSQVAKAITGTNWNGHRFFGLKAVRDRASNTKSSATPKPNSLLDIGMSPTHAAFAPATPDRSTHLATKESASARANESARRPTGEGGPKAHRIGSRKDPRSDPSEALRQAQAVQEVETPDQIAEAQRLASEWKPK